MRNVDVISRCVIVDSVDKLLLCKETERDVLTQS